MEESRPALEGLLAALEKVQDPRIDRKKLYPLIEVLFLTTSAVLSGFEDWDEIVDFGEEKLTWLRKYLPYENEIPSHDTINRVVSLIDYRMFEECFELGDDEHRIATRHSHQYRREETSWQCDKKRTTDSA
ncbi:MAG: transposase family protein [Saprospiraceae bacterium]